MSENHSDVLIIGGGAVGLCTAYYAWKNGARVTLVEKGQLGSGSSYGNAGLVGPRYFVPLATPGVIAKGIKWMFNPESPFYIKPRLSRDLFSWLWNFRKACSRERMERSLPILLELNQESYRLYEEMAKLDEFEFGFENSGLLMMYNSEKGRKECAYLAGLALEFGLEADIVDRDKIAELEPRLKIVANGAARFKMDGHLVPYHLVEQLGKFLANDRVRILTNTAVSGIERRNGKIEAVKTANGALSAAEVVITGGAWSRQLVQSLGANMLLEPAKGYSITLPPGERQLNSPLLLSESKVAVTPMGNRLRFAGTLELAGLDLSINQRRVEAIRKAVPQYLANLDTGAPGDGEVWSGMRPCSPDGLPFLGRYASIPNLSVATGHGMIGISLAPVSGKLIADNIAGKSSPIDMAPFSPERF